MIKSRFSFGFWLMLLLTALFLFLLVCAISQYYFHKEIFKISMGTSSEAHLQLAFFSIAALLFGSVFTYGANKICIDTTSKSITLKNIITQKVKSYSFDSIDGYVDTMQRDGRGNSHKTIYLAKDRKFVVKISSFFCSNYNELRDGLTDLTYFGYQSFNIIDSFRVLLGLNVLKT
jgi:hypothetical protein